MDTEVTVNTLCLDVADGGMTDYVHLYISIGHCTISDSHSRSSTGDIPYPYPKSLSPIQSGYTLFHELSELDSVSCYPRNPASLPRVLLVSAIWQLLFDPTWQRLADK